ncbi:phosphatidylserine decarboxylase [Dysgonomonas sp. PH5-45]|uniref:phosphatidylserine decarboxylase family protein n=1 Tax=unclassified Dysgonomonas TaxID=2630389 RepID=UPI002476A679|nr:MULTISPECIES: phosphatidylserine decarboxylase family protein [unclassified Dysgonomonas]MDH6353773.1 phosphatidylserine decarboxylase [Dysgonomonas sp. PH5-45]MDH6386676.1 phosphatidylserine decarboxylase [Dysgonomonas sp. PH5-37]
MKVHHEGRDVLGILITLLAIINGCLFYFCRIEFINYLVLAASVVFFLIVLNFYRSPYRRFTGNMRDSVVAPADGKIVAIEEVFEPEYFKDTRLQVSIFMSPFNVHANWFPVNGKVIVKKHHNGRFKAAYLPKSSTENERSTVVIRRENDVDVLVRQVAGAMARRIVTYPEIGEEAHIDEHFGFIKLGSRVDVYLPVGTKVLVDMDQKVTGNQTVIAELPIE